MSGKYLKGFQIPVTETAIILTKNRSGPRNTGVTCLSRPTYTKGWTERLTAGQVNKQMTEK